MEVRAVAKSVRVSPRKVRLVADTIRDLSIPEALHVLETTEKRAALPLVKALKSAVANAVNNAKLDQKNLEISSLQIAEAQALKRFQPSTRGRIHPYKKRGSHITVVLKEKAVVVAKAAKVEEKKVEVKENKKDDKKAEKGKEKNV